VVAAAAKWRAAEGKRLMLDPKPPVAETIHRSSDEILAHPGMMLFLGRDARIMILIKLIQMAHAQIGGEAFRRLG
jgi:hypothetical protein